MGARHMFKKMLFIFILASVTAAPIYSVPSSESSVKARYQKMLADEDAHIKVEIFTLAGICPEEDADFIQGGWQQEKDSLIDAYEQEALKRADIAHNKS